MIPVQVVVLCDAMSRNINLEGNGDVPYVIQYTNSSVRLSFFSPKRPEACTQFVEYISLCFAISFLEHVFSFPES